MLGWGMHGTQDISRNLQRSQIDHSSVVVEELTAIVRNLDGDALRVFDLLSTKLLEHTSKAVVPPLFLFVGLARIGRAKLN